MRLPLIISLCWAADTTRDALIVDANHRPRRLDALDAAATSESLAGARAPPPPRGLCASSRAIELQFVHIPKAGGSTIACLFDDALRANHDGCTVKNWRPIPRETSIHSRSHKARDSLLLLLLLLLILLLLLLLLLRLQ